MVQRVKARLSIRISFNYELLVFDLMELTYFRVIFSIYILRLY